MKNITIISQATLAISAGLLFTACSSMHEDEPSYSYSSTGYSSGAYSSADQSQMSQQTTTIEESSGAQTEANVVNELDIPLHEERANVGKRTVDAGQVTIRKFVTTETVSQPVELRRETLVIDRNGGSSQSLSSGQTSSDWQPGAATQQQASIANEPAGAAIESSQQASSPSASQSDAAFQEQTYTIRLQAEQPVIEKTVVQTGRVTAQKNSEIQQQNVSHQVRRENVQLDRSGSPNVEIRGDVQAGRPLEEPSGAQSPASSQDLDSDENRTPTQGQGVKDLKQQPDDQP